MKTLYIVRHGQSVANAGLETCPDYQIPLSPLGWQQAQNLVMYLPTACSVFVSQMCRAQQTSMPYCEQYNIHPIILPLLNEFSYLAWQDIAFLSLEQRQIMVQDYWQRADSRVSMGQDTESFMAFNERMNQFTQTWSEFPNNSILFGHGIWIALLVWRLLGFDVESGDKMRAFRAFQRHLPVANASVWRINGHALAPLNIQHIL